MIAIKQSKNELTQQLDREPTMTELANAVAQTEAQVRAALHREQCDFVRRLKKSAIANNLLQYRKILATL
jgi:DNA-directed RNA polymerase specialized sigma subunit